MFCGDFESTEMFCEWLNLAAAIFILGMTDEGSFDYDQSARGVFEF